MFGHGRHLRRFTVSAIILPASGTHAYRTLHGYNILAACRNPCNFYGGFNGLRARVPPEKRVERGIWHERENLLDKFEIWRVERDATLQTAGWLSVK